MPRNFANVVILPTGQLLVIGGEEGSCANNPFLIELSETPGVAAEVSSNLAPSNDHFRINRPTPRLYHAVATLLPDGRVFLGGGDDDDNPPNYPSWAPMPCQPSAPTLAASYSGEIFSPPYLSLSERPQITNAPAQVQFSVPGSDVLFTVSIDSPIAPTKVVLLRPASVTHNFDADQRYIELEITGVTSNGNAQFDLQIESPTDDLGPIGWYMLFVVAPVEAPIGMDNRSPSAGEFVRFYR